MERRETPTYTPAVHNVVKEQDRRVVIVLAQQTGRPNRMQRTVQSLNQTKMDRTTRPTEEQHFKQANRRDLVQKANLALKHATQPISR